MMMVVVVVVGPHDLAYPATSTIFLFSSYAEQSGSRERACMDVSVCSCIEWTDFVPYVVADLPDRPFSLYTVPPSPLDFPSDSGLILDCLLTLLPPLEERMGRFVFHMHVNNGWNSE